MQSKSRISELEINERRYFGRHEFDNKLHHYEKRDEFDNPGRFNKYNLRFVGISLRHKMHNNQRSHHEAPDHTGFKELRNLIPPEIDKDILNNEHGIREIFRPEEHPEQRNVSESQCPENENCEPVVRNLLEDRLKCHWI